MKNLVVDLENCYGIKKLKYKFDFSKFQTCAVYSPNGVMKTSFAKTCDDYIVDKVSRDAIFNREPYIKILSDENKLDINKKDLFVIKSFVDTNYTSDKLSTLLVRDELRLEYQEILDFLNKSKNELTSSLADNTKSTDCEIEIMRTFSDLGDNFFDILNKLLNEVTTLKFKKYDFRYNHVFENGVVKRFIDKNKDNIKLYHDKYFEILAKSDDFFTSDGSFGTAQANEILVSVEGDSFFKAGHRMVLKNTSQINSSEELKETIDNQIKKILSDPELENQFKKIDKALQPKNIQPFKKIVEEDKELLLELINYEDFQRNYWKSHLSELIDEVNILCNLHSEKKQEIEKIINEANNESQNWKSTVDTFKERFVNLPFKIDIKNTKDSVLGLKKPELKFSFIDLDTGKFAEIDREFLSREILSQGEKRAFYLINIIFEIKARLLQGVETLFIIDDIADSFDYKNKYAIVEYLHDISKEPTFFSIVLTHNFDFYRTLTSRLKIPVENQLYAVKIKGEIKVKNEMYPEPPFKVWRDNLKTGNYYGKSFTVSNIVKHILALIPFVRNLAEYRGKHTKSTQYGEDYDTLTYLLHSKEYTKKITFGDLNLIFKEHLDIDDFDQKIEMTDTVYDHILKIASTIQDYEFELENKIILAMAIRHKAEEYMQLKITNKSPIAGGQTGVLFGRYKHDFINNPLHKEAIETLESVNIMTPENIHINSFMYEPILDMGVDELKYLYGKVCNLK